MTFNFDALPGAPLRAKGEKPDLCEFSPVPESAPTRRRVLLVGQPNVGKSVVFGALTGTYVTVSNYPGTTVEISTGHATISGRRTRVVDTPGAGSFLPASEDERVTRDILLAAPRSTV